MDDKTAYWLDIAEYDMATAKAMLRTQRYLYVAFMCHQVVEKSLKAVIAKKSEKDDLPPKIHNLTKLAVRSEIIKDMTIEQKDFIEVLNPLNLEARYPEYKQNLLNVLTKEKCNEIITKTEELLCWIKNQL